jgi:Spy/CpxP family protein refolding chaperone
MRKTAFLAAAVCAAALGSAAWARQQAAPASAAATPIDDVLQAVRADLQSNRADVIAKNLTLTGAQSEKFWPLFDAYQKEQNGIMDEQLRGIQRYIEAFDTLSDADATALIKTHLDRDAKMVALRQQWLPRFQQVLGAKLGARVMQIDRRLALAQQLRFITKIPLAH